MHHFARPSSFPAQQARYRGAVDTMLLYLGLCDGCSLATLLAALETVRGRPIRICSQSRLPLPYTGLTIMTSSCDMISYRAGLSELHTNQIVCHELIHLLRGHSRAATRVFCTPTGMADDHVRSVISPCGTFDHEREYEAEYSGTYLASKLNTVRTWSTHQIVKDCCALTSLHRLLQTLAPNAFLACDPVLLSPSNQPDHFVLARMLAEISDARLLCTVDSATPVQDEQMFSNLELLTPDHATLVAVARCEAEWLRSYQAPPFPMMPAALSSAAFQSLEYYRLLAGELAHIPAPNATIMNARGEV